MDKYGSQTDIEYWGWAWCFPPVEQTNYPEWRQAAAEMQREWLRTWNPPAEWTQ